MSSFVSLMNDSELDISNATINSLYLPNINPNTITYVNATNYLDSIGLTNGQVLIGSTAAAPVAATLTEASNITITNGAGTISIGVDSSPVFSGTVTAGAIATSDVSSNTIEVHTITSDTLISANAISCESILTKSTTDISLSASKLVSTNASSRLQSVTLSNANGCNTSFSGSTLTCTMTQDLQTSGSPSFAGLTINSSSPLTINAASGDAWNFICGSGSGVVNTFMTLPRITTPCIFVMSESAQTINGVKTFGSAPILNALTATRLLATDASKATQSVTISNANGCNASFSGSTLTLTMTQNLTTTGTPTFANLIDSGLTATALVASTASKQLQSVIISNANGCNASFIGSTLTCTMTQNLQTSASPSFVALTLNSSSPLVINSTPDRFALQCATGVGASNSTFTLPRTGTTADFIVSETAQTINGTKTFGSGIMLPTSGGTATSFSYYEEYTHTTSWNGAYGASSVSGNVTVTRIGRMVTCQFPQILGTCTATFSLWMIVNLPARFCPPSDLYIVQGIAQTAAGTINSSGIFYISATGNFQFHNGVGQTFNSAGSPTVGLAQACSVTYTI